LWYCSSVSFFNKLKSLKHANNKLNTSRQIVNEINSKTGSTKYSNSLSDSLKNNNRTSSQEEKIFGLKNKSFWGKDDDIAYLFENDILLGDDGDNSKISYNSFMNLSGNR
jgi:hypothetical protein